MVRIVHGLALNRLWPKMQENTSEKQQHLEPVRAKKGLDGSTVKAGWSVKFIFINIRVCVCVCVSVHAGWARHCLFACYSYGSLHA